MSIEREVKCSAPPSFVMPSLSGVVEGGTITPVPVEKLDAVYYDTADLRLVRYGISFRWRSDNGGEWTVKFPAAEQLEGGLARHEHVVPGEPGSPPAASVGLVRAYTRTAELAPVARLFTRRSRWLIGDPTGRGLAEVDLDDVSVLDGGGDDASAVARFAEVEVELAEVGTPDLLTSMVTRLRDAGAGPADPTPKVVRALGPRALARPELAPVALGRDPTAGDVVRAGITAAVLRLIEHDRVIRLDDDPEGVHQARVATRRLRSDLRTFRPLLDEKWSEPLREELRWLADELGQVRDGDVLLGRLRGWAQSLAPADHDGAEHLLARLVNQRDAQWRALIGALDSDRYAQLLDRLVEAAQAPRLRPKASGTPARRALPSLARRPWRRLQRAVSELDDPTDDALHEVRIRAKRARYAAEVARPVVADARPFSRALAAVQDVLGDHHDAVVAEAWLREAARTAPSSQAFAAGQLVNIAQREADLLRAAWPGRWQGAARKKLSRWLA